jgi:hypothetical protein
MESYVLVSAPAALAGPLGKLCEQDEQEDHHTKHDRAVERLVRGVNALTSCPQVPLFGSYISSSSHEEEEEEEGNGGGGGGGTAATTTTFSSSMPQIEWCPLSNETVQVTVTSSSSSPEVFTGTVIPLPRVVHVEKTSEGESHFFHLGKITSAVYVEENTSHQNENVRKRELEEKARLRTCGLSFGMNPVPVAESEPIPTKDEMEERIREIADDTLHEYGVKHQDTQSSSKRASGGSGGPPQLAAPATVYMIEEIVDTEPWMRWLSDKELEFKYTEKGVDDQQSGFASILNARITLALERSEHARVTREFVYF